MFPNSRLPYLLGVLEHCRKNLKWRPYTLWTHAKMCHVCNKFMFLPVTSAAFYFSLEFLRSTCFSDLMNNLGHWISIDKDGCEPYLWDFAGPLGCKGQGEVPSNTHLKWCFQKVLAPKMMRVLIPLVWVLFTIYWFLAKPTSKVSKFIFKKTQKNSSSEAHFLFNKHHAGFYTWRV